MWYLSHKQGLYMSKQVSIHISFQHSALEMFTVLLDTRNAGANEDHIKVISMTQAPRKQMESGRLPWCVASFSLASVPSQVIPVNQAQLGVLH